MHQASTERRTKTSRIHHFDSGDFKVAIPATAFTHDGFRAWANSSAFPKKGRFSYLKGELFIDMSPERIESHNKPKVNVTRNLDELADRLDLGEVYGDGTLYSNKEAEVSTEPDTMFASWKTLETGRLRPVRKPNKVDYLELEGTSDLVVEILSDSSVGKDKRTLRLGYFQAGIDEYWLIDARGEELQFEILVRGETDYVAATNQRGWQKSTVFPGAFRFTRRRNRLGNWKYNLEFKAKR